MDSGGEEVESLPETLGDGRYRVLSRLGEGGMAVVYRVLDTRLDAERAFKTLRGELAKRKSVRTRFENEARTMARLTHPNIVTVHDVGEERGLPFMVMEYVEGGSAWSWVEQHGPMSPRHAAIIGRALLAALDLAHQRGVVHRDVKPHNVLIGADGVPKVADFGIAQIREEDGSGGSTRTGSVLGTWAYMAPEQKISARKVDARSDVYGVGATLFALLLAEEPFDLFSAEAFEDAKARLPPDLLPIIHKATRFRPDERYGSALEMLEDIEAAFPKLPPDVDVATPAPIARRRQTSQPSASISGSRTGDPPKALPHQDPTMVHSSGTLDHEPPHDDAAATEKGPPPRVTSPSNPGPITRIVEPPPEPQKRASMLPIAIGSGIVLLLLLGGVGIAVGGGFLGAKALDAPPAPIEKPVETPPQVIETPPVVVETPPPVVETPPQVTETPPVVETPPQVIETPPVVEKPKPVVEKPKPKPVIETAPAVEEPPAIEPPVVQNGKLIFNSKPYSYVAVDGGEEKRTPATVELPYGSHTLALRTEAGVSKTTTVTVDEPTERFCWDFDLDAACQ